MSLSTLFNPPSKTVIAVKGADNKWANFLELDSTVEVTRNHRAQLTNLAVESGSSVSDHRILSPFTVHVRGKITDTPFDPNPLAALAQGIGDLISGTDAVIPTQDAYHDLDGMMTDTLMLAVIIPLDSFENLIMTGFTVSQNKQSGKSIEVSLAFKQLVTITLADTPGGSTEQEEAGEGDTAKTEETAGE